MGFYATDSCPAVTTLLGQTPRTLIGGAPANGRRSTISEFVNYLLDDCSPANNMLRALTSGGQGGGRDCRQ